MCAGEICCGQGRWSARALQLGRRLYTSFPPVKKMMTAREIESLLPDLVTRPQYTAE